ANSWCRRASKCTTPRGICRWTAAIRNSSNHASPISPTLASRRPAPSPPHASCRASPKLTHGRTWILPAPHGIGAATTRGHRAAQSRCSCSTSLVRLLSDVARIHFAFGVEHRLRAACDVVRKHYLAGRRVIVYTRDAQRLAYLDRLLWGFDPTSFVPHVRHDDPLAVTTAVVLTAESPVATREHASAP